MKAFVKSLGLSVLTFPPIYRGLQRLVLRDAPVTILCYHTLRSDQDRLESWLTLRMRDFKEQIAFLRRHYDIVSLDDALVPAPTGARPRAVLTFDDGEWAMHDLLLPFIETEKLPVTIYVATRQIETGQPYWFDRVMNALQGNGETRIDVARLGKWVVGPARGKARWQQIGPILKALKAQPEAKRDAFADLVVAQGGPIENGFTPLAPMKLDQLREVADNPLVTIGAHSHGHELLDQIPLQDALSSIATSRNLLEQWTGREVRHFAYPNGNYSSGLMAGLTEAGFSSATILGDQLVKTGAAPTALPRISVGRYDSLSRLRLRLIGV